MYQLIEKIAGENGMDKEKADSLFRAFSCQISDKIPQLSQIVEDVFGDVDEDLLRQHINRAIAQIQQMEADRHRKWILPPNPVERIFDKWGGELF